MTQEEPDDIEEVSDGDLEEVKKEPEYKDASTPKDLWETFLERRKDGGATIGHGGGDAFLGIAQCTGMEDDWDKPVTVDITVGKPNKEVLRL